MLFIYESTAFDGVQEHFLANTFFEGKLELIDVIFDFLDGDAIVHTVIHGI